MTTTTGQGRTRRWAAVAGMLGVATLGMGGCGGESSGHPLSGLIGIQMTFDPAEATAVPSDVEGFEWLASYQVTLRETRGEIGGTVTRFNVVVFETVGGQNVEAEAADSIVDLPSSRLTPGGTLDVTFDTHYSLVSGGKAAFIEVTAFLNDDAGLIGDITGRLAVQ